MTCGLFFSRDSQAYFHFLFLKNRVVSPTEPPPSLVTALNSIPLEGGAKGIPIWESIWAGYVVIRQTSTGFLTALTSSCYGGQEVLRMDFVRRVPKLRGLAITGLEPMSFMCHKVHNVRRTPLPTFERSDFPKIRCKMPLTGLEPALIS